jgi:site-specific DNA recombinase
MRLVGIARVSTDEQEEEGVSLDAQEAKIRAYCKLYEIELVSFFRDTGSGKDMKREGLQEALRMLRDNEAEGIVVAKLDRLTRNLADFQRLLVNYFSEKAGFALCSIGEHVDTRTAVGRMVLNITITVNQWLREEICEKTRDALRYKKSKGERTGGVPYGKSLAADGVTLIANEAEQEWIERIKAWRTEGLGFTAIATRLNHAGVPTKKAGMVLKGKETQNLWRPGTLKSMGF